MEPVRIIAGGPSSAVPIRAAQYLRMSTEHQRYSTDNQMDALHSYALRHDMQIVRTYADEGKSGLYFNNRPALQQLLQHVVSGEADYSIILVYDVSRWGRFQDTDESAHYEFLCRQAGIRVEYCAEQFRNDGSPISAVVKSIKRAMAAEFSRELSVKVFTGQRRVAELGYRPGGSAGIGLRRMQVDENGNPSGILETGQFKGIITHRTVLVPGPLEEVALVRSIFESCVAGKSAWKIADELNAQGIQTPAGCIWRSSPIWALLRNEKYIGHNVWAKKSLKLRGKPVANAPETWVRANNAFEPVISRALYYKAQRAIQRRVYPIPGERMLAGLRRLLYENGRLSTALVSADKRIPGASTYQKRFGGLRNAYDLIGYKPKRDWHLANVDKALYYLRIRLASDAAHGFICRGITAEIERDECTIKVGAGIRIHFMVLRYRVRHTGHVLWVLQPNPKVTADLMAVARMRKGNKAVLDYYLCPRDELRMTKAFISEKNPLPFYIYRSETLAPLYEALAPGHRDGAPLREKILQALARGRDVR